MCKTQNILTILKPMLYSTKILGLAPFSLNKLSFDHLSIVDLAWSVTFTVCLGGICFHYLKTRSGHHNIITEITDNLHLYTAIVTTCGVILFNCIFNRQIVKIIKNISAIDKNLVRLNFITRNINEKYRRDKIYLTTLTVVMWIYILIVLILDIFAYSSKMSLKNALAVITYSIPTFSIFAELQFCAFNVLLRERFYWLNSKLKTLQIYHVHRKSNKFLVVKKQHRKHSSIWTITNQVESDLLVVQQISIQHHKLCTICKKLNNTYSFQLLLLILQAFIAIITVSFYLASYVISSGVNMNNFFELSYYTNLLILYNLTVIILVANCSSTARQAQKIGNSLHQILSPSSVTHHNGFIDVGVICFSLQILHHKVQFTACELFVIDETLIYTIFGAATTYLVIVLQFQLGASKASQQ